MTAVEIVSRYLAKAYCCGQDQDWTEEKIAFFVENRWREHEQGAKRLLRDLKGQPLSVVDAGGVSSHALDAMLEAMTR